VKTDKKLYHNFDNLCLHSRTPLLALTLHAINIKLRTFNFTLSLSLTLTLHWHFQHSLSAVSAKQRKEFVQKMKLRKKWD
jgi:hypothetical protein